MPLVFGVPAIRSRSTHILARKQGNGPGPQPHEPLGCSHTHDGSTEIAVPLSHIGFSSFPVLVHMVTLSSRFRKRERSHFGPGIPSRIGFATEGQSGHPSCLAQTEWSHPLGQPSTRSGWE